MTARHKAFPEGLLGRVVLVVPFWLLGMPAGAQTSSPVGPAWWSATGVTNGNASSNFSPVNVGQTKWMAKNALETLRLINSATADAIEADLVGAAPKPIPTWSVPVTDTDKAAQRSPLLIGQLKAVSDPFYRNLQLLAPQWLLAQRKAAGTLPEDATLTSNGNYPEPYSVFPWPVGPSSSEANSLMANIGQLKACFHFDFATLPMALVDSDGDGLPDIYENLITSANLDGHHTHGGPPSTSSPDASATADDDGDGYSNLAEYFAGSNPTDPASRGDGIPDIGLQTWLSASPDTVRTSASGSLAYQLVLNTTDLSPVKSNAVAWQSGAKYYPEGGYLSHPTFGFTQSNGALDLSSFPLMTSFSFILFLEPVINNYSSTVTLLNGMASPNSFKLLLNSATGYLRVEQGSTVAMDGGNFDLPGLSSRLLSHHFYTVAYTFSSNTGNLYINGELVASRQFSGTALGSGILRIGHSGSDGTKGWKGSEIIAYRRGLSADEVRRIDGWVQLKYGMASDSDRDGIVDSWELQKWGNLAQDRLTDNGDGTADAQQGNSGALNITIGSPANGMTY